MIQIRGAYEKLLLQYSVLAYIGKLQVWFIGLVVWWKWMMWPQQNIMFQILSRVQGKEKNDRSVIHIGQDGMGAWKVNAIDKLL